MIISRSARTYRERKGLDITLRGPLPALVPGANPVHSLRLRPPLPDPALLLALVPDSPDRGTTPAWPHGIDGALPQ